MIQQQQHYSAVIFALLQLRHAAYSVPSHCLLVVFIILTTCCLFAVCVFRLKELLRTKLVQSGWFEELKNHCKGSSTFVEWMLMGTVTLADVETTNHQ